MTAALGWIVAALLAGLWWGERGRRRAAERLATSGRLDGAAVAERLTRAPTVAEQLTRLPPREDPSVGTVRRMAGYLRDRLRAAGLGGLTEQADQEARTLVRRAATGHD